MAPDPASEQQSLAVCMTTLCAMTRRARAGKTMTYTELVDEMTTKYAVNGKALTDLLCELSRRAFAKGDGMIAAVVVRGDTQMPGDGFYPVARELGIPGDDEASLHHAALAEVHRIWAGRPAP